MGEVRSWEDMEMDCLLNIFQKLTLEDLTLSVPLVCKSWSKAVIDPICWQNLRFQDLDFSTESKFVNRFKSQHALSCFSFSGFMKLTVGRSYGLAVELSFPSYHTSIADLVFASEWCPRLKLLTLPSLMPADEMQIPGLIEKWKNLEQMETELKPSCFSELISEISINCNKFKGLKMSGSIEKRDALDIVKFTPKLKYLDLSRSYLPKQELLVIMKGCRDIERLVVNCCIGFQVDEDVLEMASKIKVFEHEGSRLWDCYLYRFVDCNQLFSGKVHI